MFARLTSAYKWGENRAGLDVSAGWDVCSAGDYDDTVSDMVVGAYGFADALQVFETAVFPNAHIFVDNCILNETTRSDAEGWNPFCNTEPTLLVGLKAVGAENH